MTFTVSCNTWDESPDLEIRTFDLGGHAVNLSDYVVISLKPDDDPICGCDVVIINVDILNMNTTEYLYLLFDTIFACFGALDSMQRFSFSTGGIFTPCELEDFSFFEFGSYPGFTVFEF